MNRSRGSKELYIPSPHAEIWGVKLHMQDPLKQIVCRVYMCVLIGFWYTPVKCHMFSPVCIDITLTTWMCILASIIP
ncbi:hypothetical protein BDV24DRAFT_144511 [Aspergillus arachidicola]|uniref:Uncharacterized protein n=1 Tax=Aspergillus arachidicola TaxID=656916 RepID=A0A5N6XSJ7_9EURO|nr:hypothetical protein BDV24DRAFT_144511 [Aspergillus arachidicola]